MGENPMEIFRQWVWERNGAKQKKWADYKICDFLGKEAEYSLEQLRQITHPGNAILADVENRGRGKYINIKYGWSAGRKLRKFKEKYNSFGKAEIIFEKLEPCPETKHEPVPIMTSPQDGPGREEGGETQD